MHSTLGGYMLIPHMVRYLGILSAVLLVSACAFNPHRPVQDLSSMPQNPDAYLRSDTASVPLLDHEQQQKYARDFLAQHFSAWDSTGPMESTTRPFWALEWLQKPRYALNLKQVPEATKRMLRHQVSPAQYPSCAEYAITLEPVDVRALPTSAPMFDNPSEPGEGFPFDYLQHGVLPAATPVIITHHSRDGAWAFVESALMYGWVPAPRLARVDSTAMQAFARTTYIVIIMDNVAIHSTGGTFRFCARIGTILPVLAVEKDRYRVLIPSVDAHGYMSVEGAYIHNTAAQEFPVPFTASNVATIATQMLGNPYSWGDRFTGRDCSGTMRDLFTPFGIWLPRNSGDQARVGQVEELQHLSPPQRQQILIHHGIPFATLVHLPGHIMLYLGTHQGKPALLHTLWGVKIRSATGTEQRLKVGRTVITTLEPGREQNNMFYHVSSLRERVDSINILHTTSTSN